LRLQLWVALQPRHQGQRFFMSYRGWVHPIGPCPVHAVLSSSKPVASSFATYPLIPNCPSTSCS
jgi:hypothetical protein